jgi:hypothetical protein
MSALPPKADIAENDWNVRFVPKADILRCGKNVVIRFADSGMGFRRQFAEQQSRAADVRFGSKADISACPSNVRFTPKSGHRNQPVSPSTQ